MNSNTFDDFGKLLMETVRDRTIRDWDMIIGGRAKDDIGQQFNRMKQSFSNEQMDLLRQLGSTVVDTTLHNLLFMFEESERAFISLKSDQGTIISDIRDLAAGGLQGYIFIWAERFSKERLSQM